MLFDKRQDHKKTISHKTSSVLFTVVVTTFIVAWLIGVWLDKHPASVGMIGAIVIGSLYTCVIIKFSSSLLSYKFVDQVNRMTDVAKAISNSNDLSKRVHQSSRGDELKSLEEALNSMLEQLEFAFDKQKRFVSDASHELRTPLAVLKGYLDILTEWGLKDQALLEESIESMADETQHMKVLIENLLFLARSDQDQILATYEPFDVGALVKNIVNNMKIICGSRTMSYEMDEGIILDADRELILQMLRALLENSIRYTADDGKITIKGEVVKGHVKLEISDDGIGIAEENIDRIFERFYRGENARSLNHRGSGIGLAMVKEIVEIHGGRVEIHSQVNCGTQVSITL